MCGRCVMPSPGLPATSLRTASCFPAGRVLLWVSGYLIYIILWSIRRALWLIRRALCGVELNFLPALREAAGRWSREPRAVAVHMVGGAGEARAVAADDGHQGLVE